MSLKQGCWIPKVRFFEPNLKTEMNLGTLEFRLRVYWHLIRVLHLRTGLAFPVGLVIVAAALPALLPKTAPDVRPDPPG